MTKIKTLIRASYHENYSDNGSPAWKLKGEVLFTSLVDSDALMYDAEGVHKAIAKALNSRSNSRGRYLLRSFEPAFHGIEDISDEVAATMALHGFPASA